MDDRTDGCVAVNLDGKDRRILELVQNAQNLGIELRQWNDDGEPTEIEMRVGNVATLLALSAEYLAERLDSALPLAETEETLSMLVMDCCKLSL